MPTPFRLLGDQVSRDHEAESYGVGSGISIDSHVDVWCVAVDFYRVRGAVIGFAANRMSFGCEVMRTICVFGGDMSRQAQADALIGRG